MVGDLCGERRKLFREIPGAAVRTRRGFLAADQDFAFFMTFLAGISKQWHGTPPSIGLVSLDLVGIVSRSRGDKQLRVGNLDNMAKEED